MNVYFSGIGGVGLGPLAEIVRDAGYDVAGSDAVDGLMLRQLRGRGVAISLDQDGSFLRSRHDRQPIDWLVYSAALPADHPELTAARELGIKTTKRDELLAHFLSEKNLKLIAISGTHGKTTTTGMMVWAMKQLHVPVSYALGSTMSFGPSGRYDPDSQYFVYECDEFDRNMLAFHPHLSLITSLGYDHSDTYPLQQDYLSAFSQFLQQSDHTIGWFGDFSQLPVRPEATMWQLHDEEVADIPLAGQHNRRNATLVMKACEYLNLGDGRTALESFPGTNRRFEKLAEHLYSDYGHHPEEIVATLQMARELSDHVVLVYQPHQNSRQHEARGQYADCFTQAEKVYWLPTYLSRENPDLPVLTPESLTEDIANQDAVQIADLNNELWQKIESHVTNGDLVLCMGAGSIDGWVRDRLKS
jgi:UDP-N-acetylmuramate--alanine ligase